MLFNVFEPKLVDSLLYAMIDFPLSPTLLLDLPLEAGYTFAPFGGPGHVGTLASGYLGVGWFVGV